MDLPTVHANSSTISLRLVPLSFLLSLSCLAALAFGQQGRHSDAVWRATISCDDVPVYSQMSIESMIVRYLRAGDVVAIDFEIVGSEGAWSFVKEQGRRVRLGYVQSECLDGDGPVSLTRWQRQSPPARLSSSHDSEPVPAAESSAAARPTREEIDREAEKAAAAWLSRIQSPSSTDQTTVTEDFVFGSQDTLLLPFLTPGPWDQYPFLRLRPWPPFDRFGRFGGIFPARRIAPVFGGRGQPGNGSSAPHIGRPGPFRGR